MNPWQFFWAPVFHFPFGGSVAQRIDPSTNWFSSTIPPSAGDPVIEKKAFEVASYGKQLGKVTELLLDLAQRNPPVTDEGKQALSDLHDIRNKIEALKLQDLESLVLDAEAKIRKLKKKDPTMATELEHRLAAPDP
jgi:hypothetical protein